MMSLSDKLKGVELAPFWRRRPEILCQPNIPKPMHSVAPRIVLGQEWWDKERRAAYASTRWHCIACGTPNKNAQEHQWLEGHEEYAIDYQKGRMTYLGAVPLCHYCHCFIHDGRLQAMADKGEITKKKFRLVMAHGRRVLRDAKLKKPKPFADPTAAWGAWRMVVDGVEYGPKYKTYAEWIEAFGIKEAE
ncbi:MAG: hypothetical protein Q7T05_07095 [Dehalococcoidia bacterium]|nr:hypothetical protein [Dehalococcoidia bacterium]